MSIRSCQTTSRVLCLWLYSRGQDPKFCRTHRVFKLSTIWSPILISNTQGSGEALNEKTRLAAGKPKCLFTWTVPPKTVIVFLCYNLPFNTENIPFDQSEKLTCLKKQQKTVIFMLFVFPTTGLGGGWGGWGASPQVTEGWAEICSNVGDI